MLLEQKGEGAKCGGEKKVAEALRPRHSLITQCLLLYRDYSSSSPSDQGENLLCRYGLYSLNIAISLSKRFTISSN